VPQVLGGAHVAFGPGSFMQANFGAMDAALAAIAAHVPLGSAVADLHCGVGTIGEPTVSAGMGTLTVLDLYWDVYGLSEQQME
jgi:tRNA/tmRNA/rRNA uracil-C5-methylase (TrmA/RlmC/RlmD family)